MDRIHGPLSSRPPLRQSSAGFSLLEILVSMVILTFGLLTLLQILNRTLQQSEPIEFETRAALLAQTMLEGIRSDPTGFPFLPGLNPGTWPVVQESQPIYSREDFLLTDENGDPFDLDRKVNNQHRWNLPLVFSIPGNGVDDDALFINGSLRALSSQDQPWIDIRTRRGEVRDTADGVDDIMYDRLNGIAGGVSKRDFDGGIQEDVSRDLLDQPFLANPREADSDGDGIDKDTGDSASIIDGLNNVLRSLHVHPDGDFSYDPQRGIDEEISNGEDDDGDGLTDEDVALASQLGATNRDSFPANPYLYFPLSTGNSLDDDLDAAVDEEIFDGLDNDGDGSIDEDCQAAVFPWRPAPFPAPNDEYNFQLSVRRVPVGGDGIDNDGDGVIDEEYFNNFDDDQDEFIDEDVRAYPARGGLYVTITIYQGDDRQDNDGDGWIDEEADDAIDNDKDGQVDEDVYKREFRTTALVRLPEDRL